MNLPTEVERQQVFKNMYGETRAELMSTPNAGIAETGFTLVTLDVPTLYAQFQDHDWLVHPREVIEFARNDPGLGIVQRRRFYAGTPELHTAELTYKLPPTSRYEAEWRGHYINNPKYKGLPHTRDLRIRSTSTYPYKEIITMVECRYKDEYPASIVIPLGSWDEVVEAHRLLPMDKKDAVPNAIYLSMSSSRTDSYSVYFDKDGTGSYTKLGGIEPRQEFSHPDLPAQIMIEANAVRVIVTRKSLVNNHELVLEVPKSSPVGWSLRGARGNWQSYIDLLRNHPVKFSFDIA